MSPNDLRTARNILGVSLATLATGASVSRWRLVEYELENLELSQTSWFVFGKQFGEDLTRKIADLGRLAAALAVCV
jgi:predicted transcriptional regulator